jgi:hypothetical protein
VGSYPTKGKGMDDAIEQHIAGVEAAYRQLIIGVGSRLEGGAKLWGQFTDAVASYRKPARSAYSAVYERVNELAIARILLADPTITDCRITYEPRIAADDRRIDFVVPDVKAGNLYIEVKTVRPSAKDTDENWNKCKQRRERHTAHVHYVVEKQWLGAEIYGNSFSARSKFMEYTCDFERRLAGASKVQPGRGLLVFCGTGMQWRRSELEDFSDFYHTGKHRRDDPFARMEAEALSKGGIQLQRNIVAFGYMKRPDHCLEAEKWIADLRGPVIEQPGC